MEHPVAVIGAGPVGLAAAAHLLERGLEPIVFERGAEVAANVAEWGHVRLFSPWRYSVDAAAARLLERHGWRPPPPDELPTGAELTKRYLRLLALTPEISAVLRMRHRVLAITRRDMDKVRTEGRERSPFVVRATNGDGEVVEILASAVLDASGTWWNPNPLGASGIPARGEGSHPQVHYGIPDVLGAARARYAGQKTLVVGAGHSAANTIIALAELAREAPGTSIVWATRSDDLSRVLGGGSADGLPARGKLGSDLAALIAAGRLSTYAQFRIEALAKERGRLSVSGRLRGDPFVIRDVDQIVAATGQRPDLSILRELRIDLDPALECAAAIGPLIDPNVHSCGTVRPHGAEDLAHPEPGFFVVGAKSYGRAPTFLMATGYEQVRSVAAMLAGDREAARRVELVLPETGVCRSDASESQCCASAASACC